MILFGAGNMGRHALKELQSKGVSITAMMDNNSALWGTYMGGVPVIAPGWTGEEVGVTISGGFGVKKQLRDLGVEVVLSGAQLARGYDLKTLPCPFETPEFYMANLPTIRSLLAILEDDESKLILSEQIDWRITLDDAVLSPPSDIKDIYFPEFLKPHHREIFVDCGAFDGDTIVAFKKWAGWIYRAIYAFEPVMEVKENAVVIPCAVGDKPEFTTFAENGAGSTRGEGRQVQVVTLDSVFKAETPTFIKMDIEGAEPEAIRGAAGLLSTRPVLAVCLYHKPDHLWSIPLLVHSIQPDYKFFIRHYSDECWELVLYAIPAERVK